MSGFSGKLASAVKTFGLVNGLLYSFDRLLDARGSNTRLFSYELVAQPVPAEPPKGSMMSGIQTKEIASGDPVLAEFPLDEDVLRFRFEQGAVCLGVWRKGQVLGCFWMKQGVFLEDEVRCRFQPMPGDKTIWDFDVYLIPEHRLGRGFMQLWHAAFGYMRAQGIEWSVSRISGFNERSLAAHKAMGAVKVGQAFYMKGVRRQITVSSCSPFIHFSRHPESMPTIVIKASG